ncbi:hypothetical protein FHX37_0079 [Haloactinospora alba]|uniref:Uncharacterized protein n=1 Tax=Haloactinospora alba TaxID=405555 RepID=A0A543NEE6_9ACTN|nr:hypothetical protein FHX37_0079 [Haloactinospora alba]
MVTVVTGGDTWTFTAGEDTLAWLRDSLAANGGQVDHVH